MRLDWTDHAVAELKGISEYIELDRGLEVANRVTRAIYDTIQNLRRMPRMGRIGKLPYTRELAIAGLPYVVIYQVQDERILILSIVHGARERP